MLKSEGKTKPIEKAKAVHSLRNKSRLKNSEGTIPTDRNVYKETTRLFIIMLVTIFLCEAVIMVLLNIIPLSRGWEIIADSLLLTILVTLILYWLFVRPIWLAFKQRNLAMESLRISERSLVESQKIANLGSWDLNILTNEEIWSDQIYRLLGFEPGEVSPCHEIFLSTVHPDDRGTVTRAVQEAISENKPYEAEFRVVRKDGTERIMYSRGEVKFNDAGEPVRLVGTGQDITERKKAERDLLFARQSIDDSGEGIYWIDKDARFVNANLAGCRQLGYSKEELLSMTVHDLDPNFPKEQWPSHWEELRQKGSISFDTLHRHKSGNIFPVEVRLNYIKFEDKEYNFAFVTDITERKEMEEKLRFLSSITEQVDDSVITTDLNYKITWVNKAFQRLYGYAPEEVLGRTPDFPIVEPNSKEIQNDIYEIVSSGGVWRGEVLNRKKDGSIFPCELMIFPILDEQGNIIAYAGHQRDITQRKKAEEELRRNSEELAFLLKTSQSFSTTLDLDSLLQIVINEAVNLSRLGTGVIYLLEGEMLRLRATTPPLPPQFPEELRIAPIADHPHIRQAITTRGPVIIDDTATADLTPVEQAIVKLRELRTLLYVPLLGEDNVLGVFIVGSVGEPCMISKAMINLNLTLANLAALAVQNAQFFNALKESQYDLLKSQEIAHLGHWKLDPKTGEVEGSEELFRIFGLSQKDASLEAFADVVHPDDRAYDLQHIQRGIDHREPWNIEHRLLLKDGILKWIRAIGEPSVNENGEVVQLNGIVQDITERKKAEEALQESENKYRHLFSAESDAIMIFDAETFQMIDINKAGLDLYGYSKKEFLKLKVNDISAEVNKTIKSVTETRDGKIEQIPLRYHKKKDGTVFPVEISPGSFHIKNRKVLCGIIRDITERKKADEELQKQREELQIILDSVPAGIWYKDAENRILRVNKAAAVSISMKPEDIEGKIAYELFPQEDAEHYYKDDLEVIRSGKPKLGIIEDMQVPGGEKKWVHTDKIPYWDEQGNVSGVIVFVEDITERKKAEEEIKSERQRFFSLLEGLPAYVYLQAPDYSIRFANRYFIEHFGNPEGRLCHKVLWDREEPCQVCPTFRVLDTKESQVWEWAQAPDGCTYQIYDYPFIDSDGSLLVLELGIDITEHKKAERKVLENQAQLKSLASELSITEERERRRIATELHDQIGQSLVFSKIKLDELHHSATSSELTKALDEICNNIGQIIQDTRTLTFDLSSPILNELGLEAAVADWLDVQIGAKHGIETEFEDDGQQKPLDDDIQALLFRNVRELLVNVIKHAHAHKVKVSIRKVNEHIHIDVEDDGKGFDCVKVTSGAAKETKFGLFSIRQRLEQLGGQFEIDSKPGRGSKFTMTVPIIQT